MVRYSLLCLIVLLVLTTSAKAQVIKDPVLAGLIKKQNAFFEARIPEKVYLQTDKPNYISGDTMRLKAYLVAADYLTATDRSAILYVELDDKEGKAAKRLMLPVVEGVAWCDIALDEKYVPVGSYTLRAYTNWMRNFGDDYIYKRIMYVSPANGKATVVNTNFKQVGNKVEAALRFSTLDGQVSRLKDMELRVTDGRKTLAKDQLITGMDGSLRVNFDLPVNTGKPPGPVTIQAKDLTRGPTMGAGVAVPLILNRPENTDVQFMPEGGNIVAGINTRVGFKAIGEDGKGVNITGKLINSKQQAVASFKSGYAGMGSFAFTPAAAEIYTVKIDGTNKVYPFPQVNATGTVLNIQPAASDDSLSITITASHEIARQQPTYYLIARARGVVCYAESVNFINGQPVKKSVARSLFPTGIARFTLHNAASVPLNERQVFIDHKDELRFKITNQTPKFGVRDSVSLSIEVKDKSNKPVQGYFSLAVTDDDLVRTDSMGINIRNNLLLTSDLKGDVENPGYYFINATAQKREELDDLMLTQGWIGYNWQDVFAPVTELAYQPEKEFVVQGTATNAFGKRIEKSKIVMILNKPAAVRDTLTDKAGHFVFRDLFPLDSAVIVLQARNKRGREFNISLDVEEFKEPVFKKVPLQAPWFVNTDTTLLKSAQAKAVQAKAEADYLGEGNRLKEVVIKSHLVIKGSKNLNGPGGYDEILDEEVFHKAKHKSLSELLMDRYKKEFFITPFYSLKGRRVVMYIDGVRVNTDLYMNYLTAEDIKGIEIMNSSKYAMAYDPYYISILAKAPARFVPIFLEITTYSGNGAYMKKTPGTYLYRPIPYTLPTQFYSPKYTTRNKGAAMGTDIRSTLHWEPNIVTDVDGKATVSFYTADVASAYTLIIEGFNDNGELGYSRVGIKSGAAN